MDKKLKVINYDAIEQEFARAFEVSLNQLGERTDELSFFCRLEEANAQTTSAKAD